MTKFTHCNVGMVYLSCVSAVHFLVVLVIQIFMAWLCAMSMQFSCQSNHVIVRSL